MKGLLLVNLGTPNSPRVTDVWRYLNEFLTDKRVIDLPWLKRQLLVRGVIVPFRVCNSARLYREIWTKEGSPLKVHSQNLLKKLQDRLSYKVELAMRYQNPSLKEALNRLQECSEILIFPLFPQYASATSGSVFEKVMQVVQKWPKIPSLSFIGPFYEHPHYLKAVTAQSRKFDLSTYDKVLFSFHGLPKNKDYGYSVQCEKTASLIAHELALEPHQWEMAYQSRLGKDPWLEPYTLDTLKKLAEKGAKKLLVFSPSFVADCLETLQEIGIEYAKEFRHFGGQKLDLVPSLNASEEWAEAIQSIILKTAVEDGNLTRVS